MRFGSIFFRTSLPLFLLLTAGCLSSAKPTPAAINVAVADLGRENVSSSDASMMSELLRGELAKNRSFRVVEKSNMDKILAEHDFQKTGCTDQECAVKLGRLLNVERMAVGTFGDFMGKKIVLLKLVDVGTGEIMCSDSSRGDSLTRLEREVAGMVSRLSECAASKPVRAARQTGPVQPLNPEPLPAAPPAGDDAVEEDDTETSARLKDDFYYFDLIVKNLVEGTKDWTFEDFRGNRVLGWTRCLTFTNRSGGQSISVTRIRLRIAGRDGKILYDSPQDITQEPWDGRADGPSGLPIIVPPRATKSIMLGAHSRVDSAQEQAIREREARVFLSYDYTQEGNPSSNKGELVIRSNGDWMKTRAAPIYGK
jgi:hypothetical protein